MKRVTAAQSSSLGFNAVKKLTITALMAFSIVLCVGYDIYVNPTFSPNPQNREYPTIQEAVYHAFDDTLPENDPNDPPVVRILLSDHTHINNGLTIDFTFNYIYHNVKSIIIQSSSGNRDLCIIRRNMGADNVISVSGDQQNSLKISDVTISGIDNLNGILIGSSTRRSFGILEVENCLMHNTANGVRIELQNATDILIHHCSFVMSFNHNGISLWNYPYNGILSSIRIQDCNFDGGVAMNMSAYNQYNIVVSRNTFINTGIIIGGNMETSGALIEENTFTTNSRLIVGSISASINRNKFFHIYGYQAVDVYNQGYYNMIASIDSNLFFEVNHPIRLHHSVGLMSRILSSIENNSFLYTQRAILIDVPTTNAGYQTIVQCFRNNLYVYSSTQPFVFEGNHVPSYAHTIPVSYSHFESEFPLNSYVSIDNETVTFGDPYIEIDAANHSYTLQWEEGIKSPCINTGYPGENYELTDLDGTPPDIGSVYYPHVAKKYTFQDRPPEPYIFWMCFPVVDNRSNPTGQQYWNELGYMFYEHMLGAPNNSQLNSILWSYNGNDGSVFFNQSWQNADVRSYPPIGYKVKLNVSQPYWIEVNGFRSDPETTPVAWVERDVNNNLFSNWVGYFVPQSQCAYYSLNRFLPGSDRETYLDYVYSIKTQWWSTHRLRYEHGSPWIIGLDRFKFMEGDVVVLQLLPDAPAEMFWNVLPEPSAPYVRPEAQQFSYEEKLDYTPVYVEFDPDDMPDEVGIMVNGKCYGAAVVDAEVIGINYYADDDKAAGFELCFYYAGKGKVIKNNWRVFNPETLVFEDSALLSGSNNQFHYLSFQRDSGSSPIPLQTTLEPNYPNPFNPETRISFTLASETPARLDIYNLKGQRVRTLADGTLRQGRHTVVWNGRDDQNRAVASGVYFYRLSMPQQSMTQKMMLLK